MVREGKTMQQLKLNVNGLNEQKIRHIDEEDNNRTPCTVSKTNIKDSWYTPKNALITGTKERNT